MDPNEWRALDKYVKMMENKSLSELELKRIAHGKCRIVSYDELYRVQNIEQILRPHGAFALLYETKPSYGHWVGVFKKDANTISVFDPYGYKIDNELRMIPAGFREESHQDFKHLTRLIKSSTYKNVEWNEKPMQKFKPGVSTCGRFVGLRLAMRNLSLDEFRALFKDDKLSADWIATFLTLPY
jgi:hypothetical protein